MQLLPNNQLSWVCLYPNDASASAWSGSVRALGHCSQYRMPSRTGAHAPRLPRAPQAVSFASWAATGGNYFSNLSASGVASSCALKGPCYPVVTSQANVWQTCQTQTLKNLPLSTSAVNGLTNCINCCGLSPAAVATTPACSAIDVSTGANAAFQWTGVTGANASANDRIGCLQSCQELHGSIDSFAADTTGSVHPLALALFDATCAAAGAPAAAIPAPGTVDDGAMSAVLGAIASSYKATALRYVGDMMLAWKALVVCGLFLPFALSFFWLAAIRVAVGPMVWLTVLLVDLATAGVTLYCFSKSGAMGNNAFDGVVTYSDSNGFSFNSSAASGAFTSITAVPAGANSTLAGGITDAAGISKRQMYYLGIVSAIMTIVTWLFTIILIPRLRVAVAVIRVAVDALKQVPTLMVWPFFGSLAISGFMVWWVAVGIFVYSSGKLQRRNCTAQVQAAFASMYPSYPGTLPAEDIHCGYEMKMNNALRHALIYHGFEFLWTTQFIISFSILTVAQVVYKCYLSQGGAAGVALPRLPLLSATRVTIRYYLGTVALGSLVVASVQFFRYVCIYLMRHAKKLADANKLVRILMWLVNCLLWALQKLVEFLERAALVVVAISGEGFCSSAATASRMLASNALRFGTLNIVADGVLFLGKIMTAASSAFFTFVYLDKTYPAGKLSSPIIPVIVVFLTAFAIASVGFGVVEQAITATIVSMIDDEEKHGGQATWAPPALKEATGVAETHEAEVKAKNEARRGCCGTPAADA